MVKHLAHLLDFLLGRKQPSHERNDTALERACPLELVKVDSNLHVVVLTQVGLICHLLKPGMRHQLHHCRTQYEVLSQALFDEINHQFSFGHGVLLQKRVVGLIELGGSKDLSLGFSFERWRIGQHYEGYDSKGPDVTP
jgi:hypothetical protein